MTEWTTEDSAVASAEGWGLSECQDPEHPPWELQRNDSPDDGSKPTFNGDTAAWRHVATRAREDSVLHQRAIDFLAGHSPWVRNSPSTTAAPGQGQI